MQLNKDKINYHLIRCFLRAFSPLPYPFLRFFGKIFSRIGFYFLTDFRKCSLSNLALAKDLHLTHKQCYKLCKHSFENLAINCLEYAKWEKEDHFDKWVVCENPQVADNLHKKGQGIIFFCGHQANWELLFLDGSRRMKGVAIAKPTKNRYLYRWILKVRQRFGGIIVDTKKAFRSSMQALKQGYFVGIVGDQGMPDSGYSHSFLGRKAWTSPLPALLSIKTNSPIIVATIKRVKKGYRIHYGDPIWPDLRQQVKKESHRLMDSVMKEFEESIKKDPGQWFWQHNRWKQQTPHILYRRFRKDSLLLILPDDETFSDYLEHLSTFRLIYPKEMIFLLLPESKKSVSLPIDAQEIFYYSNPKDMKLQDLRFKLIFNFSSYQQINRYFLRLSAYEVLSDKDLFALAKEHLPDRYTLSELFLRSLCRPNSLWRLEDAS